MMKIIKWASFFAAIGCFTRAYILFKEKRERAAMARRAAELEANPPAELKRMPSRLAEEGYACTICLANPLCVITSPCNHLAMCRKCYEDMKAR